MHQKILSIATKQLSKRQYENIVHTRLSHEPFKGVGIYQGLTNAIYQNQQVKIKWQLVPSDFATNYRNLAAFTSFDQEFENFKQINRELKNPECYVVPVIEFIDKYQFNSIQKDINFKDYDLNDVNLNNVNLKDSTIDLHNEHVWQFSGYIMPYSNIGSVKDLLRKYSLTHSQTCHLLISMASSLLKLHESGWIHGDVKPSNFLVAIIENDESDRIKFKQPLTLKSNSEFSTFLIDLSCSRRLKNDMKMKDINFTFHTPNISIIMDSQKQRSNMGTPAYLSPECWKGKPLSIGSDIYAFGISMYEILTGCKPFKISSIHDNQNNKTQISEKIKINNWAKIHCQNQTPLLPDEWRHFQTILDKLMAKKIENRISNLNEVVLNLRYHTDGI